jgi:hypothetical protein
MFKDLFLASFKYTNLPTGINSRYMENALFENGTIAFIKDDVTERFLALKATSNGVLDVYYEPTSIMCYGGGMYQKERKNHINSVLMYNNLARNTPLARLEIYARRIAHIEHTIDININAQKTPYIVSGNKRIKLSLEKIIKQMAEFVPSILVDDSLSIDDTVKVYGTNAPYVVDKLDDEKRRLINEALSLIGIENNSSEKNERLLHDEILVSNGLAIANRNSRLQARQMAIDEINELFGLDIEVEFNNPSFFSDPNPNPLMGGEL